jgi:hypothetical protein|tara:strand:- start:1199 stop:1423 length:225 start_codon:yes stop_codon:yes gene_type:complete
MNINELVEQYPNDMELGSKVREMYWKEREVSDMLKEKMKDAKIYESPDGGNTIYERPWGSDLSERKLINKNEIN